jgi:hypothetical protein
MELGSVTLKINNQHTLAVMGFLKQLMIFGKPGLRGLPTRVTLFL